MVSLWACKQIDNQERVEVLRKPTSPSFGPKSEAGTTQIPIVSNKPRVYKLLGVVPCFLALTASIAFGGIAQCIHGGKGVRCVTNAPGLVRTQEIPSISLRPATATDLSARSVPFLKAVENGPGFLLEEHVALAPFQGRLDHLPDKFSSYTCVYCNRTYVRVDMVEFHGTRSPTRPFEFE